MATPDYKSIFLDIMSEAWDKMAGAVLTAEAIENRLNENSVKADFDLSSFNLYTKKLVYLKVFEQLIYALGLGADRDELFRREADHLWGVKGGGPQEKTIIEKAVIESFLQQLEDFLNRISDRLPSPIET